MDRESQALIALLRQEVVGRAAILPQELDWTALARLAKWHGLEGFVYCGVRRLGLQLPEAIWQQLEKAYQRAVFWDAQFDFVRQQLEQRMTALEVPHIFLRGICLKGDYPVPALRTMSDIDILVRAEDFGRLKQAAEAMGGMQEAGDGNHRIYRFPCGVLVEFHPNLLHHASPVGTQINPGWQYAAPEEGFGRQLTEEGFYLNLICHLAHHFASGGVGVRFIMDVWVDRHLRKTRLDRAFVEAELERFGLLEFARNVEALAEGWFGGGEMTPLLEQMGRYVFTSGTHGTTKRAMLNAVSLSKSGSRRSALLGKMFYPRQELEDRYCWVRGKPWLLPAAWCARAWKAVVNHGGLILRWGKGTAKLPKEEVSRQREMLWQFGIRRKEN